MKIKIKNFENINNQKMVGFTIISETDKIFVIDKYLPLTDKKSDEQYVKEALALCQPEIDEWKESFAVVGRTWNPDTGSFE